MWTIYILSQNTTYRLLSLPRIIRSSCADSFQMRIIKKALNHQKILISLSKSVIPCILIWQNSDVDRDACDELSKNIMFCEQNIPLLTISPS